MSEESIKNPPTPKNSFISKWIDNYTLPWVKFNVNSLRQESVPFLYKNVVNLYVLIANKIHGQEI